MLAVIFEILAVIFGTIALFAPKLLNPEIKFSDTMISKFATLKNCGTIYRFVMSICFLFNAAALYFYIGSIGLFFLTSLFALIIDPGSKVHLFCAFIAFLIYSFSSVIYNPSFLLNYLPIFGLIYAVFTFRKNKSDSLGIVFLVYSAAALMLINILLIH